MNTKSLCVCLIAVLAGCAGRNLRGSAAPGDAGVSARGSASAGQASVKTQASPAVQPQPQCVALDVFSQHALWKVWEELARAGVAGAPPLFAVDPALPPPRSRRAAPLVCTGAQSDGSGFAILLLPALPEMRGPRHPSADLLMPEGPAGPDVRFWTQVDPEQLLRKLPSAPQHGRLLIPFDGGSLLRLAPPSYGAQAGVLLEGQETEPSFPRAISSSVSDDMFDYRFRLPTGTARVLIVHF